MYVKLFSSILTSSVWAEDASVRVVWITLLALCDKDGDVRSSPSGLARLANVSVEDCHRSLAKFLAPDSESGTQEYEGRRIEECEGGWHVLNYSKYRVLQDEETRKAQWRESSRRHRQRKSAQRQQKSAHTEAEAEAEGEREAKTTATTSARKRAVTWLTPYLLAWETHYGVGSAASLGGRLAMALKPLHDAHGEPRVLEQLGAYLAETEPRFANPQTFAQRFAGWGNHKPTGKIETGFQHLKDFANEVPRG